ncbi:MAG: crossover junction endodeoxyribonuclease RuvC [Candidatus Eremiobacteraeota bacterium]|nr:crossover junction endodeoxyribonuclease RuvC [Candidatus Eremiobacteraeota bacterium]MBV9737639.1 crossover junction endodeoxyribonuclease RuvC [Candidatus Eremiobacteraeota bacterium]
MSDAILGIDPGTQKAGFAVVEQTSSTPLVVGIERLEHLIDRVRQLLENYKVQAIALGRGTHASAVAQMLSSIDLPVHLIDEHETTWRARALYFADHPPRGWRRLIPLGLLLPPRPIDDYAAVLIARRFLEQTRSSGATDGEP